MKYDYKFLIKIISAPSKVVWYYRYIGETFETKTAMKNKKIYYFVDYLHAVPAEHCYVIKKTIVEHYNPKYKK
jgi:hypothetical protein